MKYFLAILIWVSSQAAFSQGKISPGKVWNDNNGVQINAHGSSIVFDKGTYYWFGEDRTAEVSNGVSCYKSKDLYSWERVGLALKTTGEKREDLNDISQGRTLERPKVIYNKETKKYVMWAHWETGQGYAAARVCVATSDNIEGPYQFYKTFRPNTHDSRDQTLFQDSDGKAYHFGSTDMNTNMNLAQLKDDYLEPSATETKILNGLHYEAPAIFRVGDMYYGLFSGTTGWDPNPGRTASTPKLMQEWKTGANFAVDPNKLLSYGSQSAYVFKVADRDKAFVYVGDRWNPKDVGKSHHVWLPISMRSGYPTIRWYDSWDLSVFEDMYRFKRAREIVNGNNYALLERNSNRIVSKPANGFTLADDSDSLNLSLQFVKTEDNGVYRLKDVKTGSFIESVFGTLRLSKSNESDTQKWKFQLQEDGYYRIQNQHDQKCLSVSGSGTFNGTGLFLTDISEKVPQYFAVYFDSKLNKYDEADIFSSTYFDANKKRIESAAK